MNKCKLIEGTRATASARQNDSEVILHEDITNILFSHKEEIHNKLIDLRGLFLIDHFAIKIIDPTTREERRRQYY